VLRAELDAERELRRRLELRLAELERRLPVDSSDSGTPSSKERTGAKQARRARQQSERERRADRRRGGQPGHPGKGLDRDPDKEQVFLFTRDFAADWTTNVAERGAKSAKRHQAVSGYWHSLATLARWCRIRSYLDSAAAHRITALDAIRDALNGKPWLPPLPAIR
jgi:hypothetical protein